MPFQYEKAPLIEAVVEFRLPQPMAMDRLEKIFLKLKKRYSNAQTENTFEMQLGPDPKVIDQGFAGYRLTNDDSTDSAVLRPNSLTLTRAAPYTGWEPLYARAQADFTDWTKGERSTHLQRIGGRYINRIDVYAPAEGDILELHEYITVGALRPDLLQAPMTSLSLAFGQKLSDRFTVMVRADVVASPLIDHMAIQLDLDVATAVDIPHTKSEIFDVLTELRDWKNKVFEACITDKARELFH